MTTLDPLPHLYATYSDNIGSEDCPSLAAYSHRHDSNEVEQGVLFYFSSAPHDTHVSTFTRYRSC